MRAVVINAGQKDSDRLVDVIRLAPGQMVTGRWGIGSS